ncbi:MAG: YwqG family protein [Pseudomonadota bacterium]
MKVIITLLVIAAGIILVSKRAAGKKDPIAPALADAEVNADLAAWKAAIDEAALPAQRIILTGEPAGSAISSKVGGVPYWTADADYPTAANGQPMHLLAQINFADIDQPLAEHPQSGLLQFYIAAGDLYGSDFTKPGTDDSKNRDYAVVFHPEPKLENHTPPPKPTRDDEDYLPFEGESGIRFERFANRVSPVDYRFEQILPGLGQRYDDTEPLYEYAIQGPSHQMGGYAVFTQTDPREYGAKTEDWQLLFQLDSEQIGALDMMWGDLGIANFFIRPDDLAQKKFDLVWYNWDCS